MVGVMTVMATSFKRTCASTVVSSAPDPATGHYPPIPPPESWTFMGKSGSVSCGVGSFLLGPGVHKVLFVPSKSLFPHPV